MNYIKLTLGIAVISLINFSCNNTKKESAEAENTAGTEELMETAESTPGVTASNDLAADSTSVKTVANDSVPKFDFTETEFDFGAITEGQVVTHVFEFTNTGKSPLIIENATATCGCTVPNYPHEPIAPGKTGKIEVKFNSQGKSGQQNKVVTITANTNPKETKVALKGEVKAKG